MLFKNKELQSNFDIGKDLSNEQANINCLAEEIIRITEKIYNIEGKIVCRHRDQNNREVFVDRVSIDEATWDRGKEEIKQILVRNDKSRFALNNRLKVFGVYEPSESLEYKKYLQVLYFFYIMNYFIFPKENIFKSLSLENVDYKKSYEEGALKGNHLSFIVLNLFDDEEAFYYFCNTNNEFNNISYQIEKLIENMAYKRFDLASNDKLESIIENIIYENQIEVKGYNVNPIIQLVEHCNQYNRLVYSVDLLNNLDNNFQELFYTEEFEILPPDIWKNMHISLEDLNEFLMSDDLFYFCKQTIGKIESKQRHNFLNSNAVKFLRNAIEYDKQWIDTFDENEGLYIEKIDDKYTIYPLKVAIFLRTYDELTNKRKVKILSGNKKSQLLKSLLTNNNDPFPQSLPMQIFSLVCHFQYDNITKEIPFGFYNYTTLLSERLFCTIMIKTTETYNFDMNIKYLNTLYDDLCDLVEVLK
ncbi:hypothetical protein C7U54_06265 [Faecalibacillus intestinalis]|uniref:Uncharacterized protein n=1 Tax=Faecalibacillus intestinalis TaxID=1982626 RepID=A0A2T3G302_9FIRM|nr:hypothetical protein [Faecalibacillus intestinalis]PST41935.1 hypothetical protein C7U54_06265 [Faecalibacillus intestinalis]